MTKKIVMLVVVAGILSGFSMLYAGSHCATSANGTKISDKCTKFVDKNKDGKCDVCGTCTEADCKTGCKTDCKDNKGAKCADVKDKSECKTDAKTEVKTGCGSKAGCGK